MVLLLAILGGWYYLSRQDEKASSALAQAVRTLDQPIRPAGMPAQPDFPSYSSTPGALDHGPQTSCRRLSISMRTRTPPMSRAIFWVRPRLDVGTPVGVRGMAEPGAIRQHAVPGCGKEAHLCRQLPRLFAAVIEFGGKFPVEEDNCFTKRHAVLCAAETEDIHPRLPGNLPGGDIERGDGVGEPGAIHMEA